MIDPRETPITMPEVKTNGASLVVDGVLGTNQQKIFLRSPF